MISHLYDKLKMDPIETESGQGSLETGKGEKKFLIVRVCYPTDLQ
jgi:hypothetical protein